MVNWRTLSLSAKILIGLFFGALAGLFFGESAAVLQPAADIYIRLMQMTVLPYLVTSLILAFGQLDSERARRLLFRGGALLLVIWLILSLIILLIPLTFPTFTSAAFFSHSLVEPKQSFSLTEIYFTSNPFASLAQNVVPAVVLFSSLIGIGLIGLDGRESLLKPLKVANLAVVRITHLVIGLTPYGVFAIAAVAAGTLHADTLTRLEVYLIAFACVSLLLGFVILPLLVTAVTPFKYGEVAGIARDALLTAFVANSAFIVLPILIERSKELLERHGLLDESADAATEVLIPVLFNFPNAGKLLTLLFVPFAAWLAGTALAPADYPQLLAAGIPSYFAKAQVALPYLLDLFGLPQDLFQLYIPTTIITGKFDSLVTAMNLLVFALLGAGALSGFLIFRPARLLRAGVAILGSLAVMVIGLKLVFAVAIDTQYHLDEAVRSMDQTKGESTAIVYREQPATGSGRLTLEQIQRRGTLRFGYDPYNLPMSFFNAAGELVGFDIALAQRLADSLGLKAEFVPISWPDLPQLLASGTIDLMPGVWYRPFWFNSLQLSEPYFTATVGFAVLDADRDRFASLEDIRESEHLRIGVPLDVRQLEYVMQRYFAGTDAEFERVEFWQPYFEGKHPDLDAFLMTAEHAAGWSLLHPEYTVVVPQPDPVAVPTGFGMALGQDELQRLVDEWILFADKAGIVRENYDFWVLGQGAQSREPRWSIVRNVLGWVD